MLAVGAAGGLLIALLLVALLASGVLTPTDEPDKAPEATEGDAPSSPDPQPTEEAHKEPEPDEEPAQKATATAPAPARVIEEQKAPESSSTDELPTVPRVVRWSPAQARAALGRAQRAADARKHDEVLSILSPAAAQDKEGRTGFDGLPVDLRINILELLALSLLETSPGQDGQEGQAGARLFFKEILKLNPDFRLPDGDTDAARLLARIREDPPRPISLDVVVRASPSNARIYRDGEPLGASTVLSFESSSSAPIKLTVKAPNHKSTAVNVRPTDGTLVIKLKRNTRTMGIAEEPR